LWWLGHLRNVRRGSAVRRRGAEINAERPRAFRCLRRGRALVSAARSPTGAVTSMLVGPAAAGEICGAGGSSVCGAPDGGGGCSPLTCPAGMRNVALSAMAAEVRLTVEAVPPDKPVAPGAPADAERLPGPVCAPLTCVQASATCGKVGDGCGGLLDCGTCVAPDSCGGGGAPNVLRSPDLRANHVRPGQCDLWNGRRRMWRRSRLR